MTDKWNTRILGIGEGEIPMKETKKKVGYIKKEVKLGGSSIMEVNRGET